MNPVRRIPFLLVLLAAGCSADHAEFTGQVFYRGKSIYRGSITVVGDDKVPHIAAIGDDGTFRFDKVPTGVVKVAVQCPEPTVGDSSPSSDQGKKLASAGITTASDARRRWIKIPERLGDPNSSNMTAEITAPTTNRQIELPD